MNKSDIHIKIGRRVVAFSILGAFTMGLVVSLIVMLPGFLRLHSYADKDMLRLAIILAMIGAGSVCVALGIRPLLRALSPGDTGGPDAAGQRPWARTGRGKMLLDSIAEAVLFLDPKGTCVLANTAALSLLGYKKEAGLVGRTIDELIYHVPGDKASGKFEACNIYKAFSDKACTHLPEKSFKREDGSILAVECWAQPVFHQGRSVGIAVTFSDITGRKQAESELAAYRVHMQELVEERTRALSAQQDVVRVVIDSIPSPVSYIDTNERFLFNNRAHELWYDKSISEITGRTVREILGDLQYESIKPYIKEALSGELVRHSIVMDMPDNSKRFADMTMVPDITDDDSIRGVFMLTYDITDQKEAEDALQQSEEMFRVIFETLEDGWFNISADGRFLMLNPAMAKMLGAGDPAELTGRDVREFLTAPGQWEAMFEHLSDNGRLDNYELELKVRGGSSIVAEIKVQPVYDDTGLIGMEGLLRDITERKRTEKELREYASVQSVLVKEINHRVKNNIYAIIAMINAEKERVGLEGRELIERLGRRVLGLSAVHDMLSRSEWRPLPLEWLFKEIIRVALSSVPMNKHVSYTVGHTDIRVSSMQASQLAMLINELATNSVKHGLMGREDLLITLDSELIGEEAMRITYRDNGPGYPDKMLHDTIPEGCIGFDVMTSIAKKSLGADIRFRNEGGAICEFEFILVEKKTV